MPMTGLVPSRPHPPGSDRAVTRKKRDESIHGRAKWEGRMREADRCRAYGQSGKIAGVQMQKKSFLSTSDVRMPRKRCNLDRNFDGISFSLLFFLVLLNSE